MTALLWDLPGDVLAAPASALCGWKGVTLSLSLSLSRVRVAGFCGVRVWCRGMGFGSAPRGALQAPIAERQEARAVRCCNPQSQRHPSAIVDDVQVKRLDQ